MYYVGGAVRDYYINQYHPNDERLASKDIDFAIEADSYDIMLEYLKGSWNVEVMQEDAKFGRIIGKIHKSVLKDHPILKQVKGDYVFADFVMCRKDGSYSDHRRPDTIEYASIREDLARRDFTINSLAIKVDGPPDEVLDPFGGIQDIIFKTLRFTGGTYDRVTEDFLRVVRLYRFKVVLNKKVQHFEELEYEWTISKAVSNVVLGYDVTFSNGIKKYVSEDRIREELLKMFKYNTLHAMHVLSHEVPPNLRRAMLSGPIWLEPTTRERGKSFEQQKS
jgi:tRNA nucleotidyltransferase/poly(A) polymerase